MTEIVLLRFAFECVTEMDITGQYFCSFNIKGQPFNDEFKVVLEASVSVYDKFGILQTSIVSKLPSKQILIKTLMIENMKQGLELSDVVFDSQIDEYFKETPCSAKSKYDETTTVRKLLDAKRQHGTERKERNKPDFIRNNLKMIQKMRLDCFWIHLGENETESVGNIANNPPITVISTKMNSQHRMNGDSQIKDMSDSKIYTCLSATNPVMFNNNTLPVNKVNEPVESSDGLVIKKETAEVDPGGTGLVLGINRRESDIFPVGLPYTLKQEPIEYDQLQGSEPNLKDSTGEEFIFETVNEIIDHISSGNDQPMPFCSKTRSNEINESEIVGVSLGGNELQSTDGYNDVTRPVVLDHSYKKTKEYKKGKQKKKSTGNIAHCNANKSKMKTFVETQTLGDVPEMNIKALKDTNGATLSVRDEDMKKSTNGKHRVKIDLGTDSITYALNERTDNVGTATNSQRSDAEDDNDEDDTGERNLESNAENDNDEDDTGKRNSESDAENDNDEDDTGKRKRRRCSRKVNYKALDNLHLSGDSEMESSSSDADIESVSVQIPKMAKNFNGSKCNLKKPTIADPDYQPSDLSGMSDNEDYIDKESENSSLSEMDEEGEYVPTKARKNSEKCKMHADLSEHADKFEVVKFVSSEQKDRGKPVEEISHDSFACKICNSYQTADKEALSVHIGQHLQNKLRCKLCELELPSEFKKLYHMREEHPEKYAEKGTVCELCGIPFRVGYSRYLHMYRVHNIPSIKCRLCHKQNKTDVKKFATLKELHSHEKECHPDEIHHCNKCGKHFAQKYLYKRHKLTCQGEQEKYQCKECSHLGYIYTKVQLRNHVRRTHIKEKICKCELCDYVAYTRCRVRRHMAHAHLDLKKYECSLCPFAAVQLGQLKSHMRTHTGDKPYKCDQCSYAAAWNVQLKDHIKVHDLPDTVTCQKCGIVVKDSKALKRHENREHTDKLQSKGQPGPKNGDNESVTG